MAVQLITQAVKRHFFEQKHLEGPKQLNDFLFPKRNESINAAVDMDSLDIDPFAVSSMSQDGLASTDIYRPGSTQQYIPEIGSRQTPITQEMRDQAVVGLPATSPHKQMMLEKARQIVEGHVQGYKMKNIHQALEVFLDGTETYYYADGSVKQQMDFGRDAALKTTSDFTSITMDAHLKTHVDLLEARGADVSQLCCIMGSSWLNNYESSTVVQGKQKNNPQNIIVTSEMSPPNYKGVQGLRKVGMYRPAGSSVSITILAYSPGTLYKQLKADSGTAFMPATRMTMFSEAELGTTFLRGFPIINNAGKIVTVKADMAFDGYVDKAVRNEFVRSTDRVMYGLGKINHTCSSTGSNF